MKNNSQTAFFNMGGVHQGPLMYPTVIKELSIIKDCGHFP